MFFSVVPLVPCVVPQLGFVVPLVPCVVLLPRCVVPLVPCVVPLLRCGADAWAKEAAATHFPQLRPCVLQRRREPLASSGENAGPPPPPPPGVGRAPSYPRDYKGGGESAKSIARLGHTPCPVNASGRRSQQGHVPSSGGVPPRAQLSGKNRILSFKVRCLRLSGGPSADSVSSSREGSRRPQLRLLLVNCVQLRSIAFFGGFSLEAGQSRVSLVFVGGPDRPRPPLTDGQPTPTDTQPIQPAAH